MRRVTLIDRVFQQPDINFILTNRIPRRMLTRFVGWFTRIEQPVVRDASIRLWTMFAGELNLREARKTTFSSLHDCFVRELAEDARPVDRDDDVLVSPCDGTVDASGSSRRTYLFQVKGSRYALGDLRDDSAAAVRYRDGQFVTLRLTSAMYLRFHAPHDC